MPKLLKTLLLPILFFNFSTSTIHGNEIATQSATVTAHIPTISNSSNLAPTPPILIRPTDHSFTADNTPEFVWQPSTDPDGNTIYYDVYINNVATYLGVSNTGNTAHTNYTSTIVDNEIRLIPTQPLPDGEYTWYVKAYDPALNAQQSATWHLTINTTPPEFTLTDIDIYHQLNLNSNHPELITSDTDFKVSGPKDIYFTIQTQPSTTIQLSIYTLNHQFITQTSLTTSATSTTLYPYVHLQPNTYLVQIVAIDKTLLTSTLPEFKLTVTQPTITLINPLSPLSKPLTIPYSPFNIPTLPATISLISSRVHIAFAIIILLAVIIYLLLIFIWKKRYNLLLLQPNGKPITSATIYHSIPDFPTPHPHSILHSTFSIPSPILLTHQPPHSYLLDSLDQGKLYIPHLSRYSTLTIRTKTSLTILSISNFHPPITLTIS